MKKITVLIPAYNESASLPRLAAALSPLIDNKMTDTPYEWEILIVNDGSRDNTLAIIKELHEADPRYQYLNLSRNFGKENAMLAGLDYASGNAVVIMDADMQHPVDVIPLMIEQWEQGYDDVYGRRSSRGKESIARRQLTKLFYRILQKSTRIDILPNVGDFRLLDRKCINALRQLRETQRYSKGLFSWIGFSKKEIMFEQGSRTEGKSSFNFLSAQSCHRRHNMLHHSPAAFRLGDGYTHGLVCYSVSDICVCTHAAVWRSCGRLSDHHVRDAFPGRMSVDSARHNR